MSILHEALSLAERGFHVFPLVQNSKLPAVENYPEVATRDPDQIRRWWIDPVLHLEQPFNIGISTTRFGETGSLLVIDVDNKGSKRGDESLLDLELQGFDFPKTYTQTTPTGGRHLVYFSPHLVKQGVSVLGDGLDIRARGGYIVGAGSVVDGGRYENNTMLPMPAPGWLLARLDRANERAPIRPDTDSVEVEIDQDRAKARALEFLDRLEPATEGERNHRAFTAACGVKDFGVDKRTCYELMLTHWKCEPPLDQGEIEAVVRSAYRYGTEPVGVKAPELDFSPADGHPDQTQKHPFDRLNEEYAFVLAGGGSHILWETVGPKGGFRLEHLSIQAFHQKNASWTIQTGDGKIVTVTGLWMKSHRRRSYDGICFMPGLESPPRFYNLWQGFAVEPLGEDELPTPDMKVALELFLQHAKENVCANDEALFQWLIGYFAHLVQRPWEKPLVALVFRGSKGVGKNALIERVGHLIGNHFVVTSDRRYLIGNFNGHLENMLLFTLDEAFWSGDKQAEGVLKNLITGRQHVIEHKGKEPYVVDNCTRVVIIGNEDWLVPASHDERRFAVFNVGEGKKQHRRFFQTMRELMEAGGYRYLLRYLLDVDLSKVDVNEAPSTTALLEQKVSSLDPFHQWWLDCLTEGRIVASDFGSDWPVEIEKDRFRYAFRRYVKDRQIRSRIPEDRSLGRELRKVLPSVDTERKRKDETGDVVRSYGLPPLESARKEWEHFIKHPQVWE